MKMKMRVASKNASLVNFIYLAGRPNRPFFVFGFGKGNL